MAFSSLNRHRFQFFTLFLSRFTCSDLLLTFSLEIKDG